MSTMFPIQFAIVLLYILTGAQVGGIGLGAFGSAGLAVLAFGFHLGPTSLPIDAMLMIMAVASATASMQASDGLNYMIKIAIRVLYRNLKYITFIALAVTYLFIVLAGTGHVVYPVLPVIAEASRRNGIRPLHPLAMAVTASQFVIVAGPITMAVVACVTYLEPQHTTMADVLRVTVPSTTLGIGLTCMFINRLGKELKDDPHYQRLLAKPEHVKVHEKDPTEHTNFIVSPRAKLSVGIFLAAALLVVVMGVVPELCPTLRMEEGPKLMGTAHTIEIIILPATALIILLCKPDGSAITRGSIFYVGVRAVIAVFGVAWLGDILIHGHLVEVKDTVSHLVETVPWTFAATLFVLSALADSQDVIVATLFPIAILLNVLVPAIIGTLVAVSGYFFIPNYDPIIVAIDFDSTGSTKVGKYIFNHSFMIPGLLSLIFSLISGLMLAEALLRT